VNSEQWTGVRDSGTEKAHRSRVVLSHPCARKNAQGWGTADSSSKCNNASRRPATRCQETSHGKDRKQRTFPTFPRHGYGYPYGSIHGICCTWNLNVPTGLLFLIPQVHVFPYCPTSASLYMYLIADLYTRVLVRPRTLSVLRSYHSMQPSTCSPSSSTITICVCD
jgi:hypothetical protein